MAGLAPGAGDEDDVAQSAFYAFCDAATGGRLRPIESRDELWRLLLTLTRRKAINRRRHERRIRRGGLAAAVNNAGFVNGDGDRECPPVELVELQESLNELFQKLAATGDSRLTKIARRRLEGFDNQEIANELGCAVRTIQRKLSILERLWTEQQ
jgi:DNA-directed RNA polymerase specialized sigma24 family protein